MTSYPIVGSFYRPPAKAIISALPAGTRLELRPEPENRFDANAIAVYVKTSEIPESCHRSICLSGADSGFRIGEDPAESFENFLELILAEPEWHLGYVPRTLAAKTKLHGSVPAQFSFDLAGKPQATRIRDYQIEPEGIEDQ